ncbi:MAG TPA: helix-turn-helix domain-containing protein [Terriglobales bacterium]|nr:helix-turn-helix domain-containing protein [Terriglobales bacterium]
MRKENANLPPAEIIFGHAPTMAEPRARATTLVAGAAPSLALLTGPRGSGKRTLARWLHAASPRSAQPWRTWPAAVDGDAAPLDGARGTVYVAELGDLAPARQSELLAAINDPHRAWSLFAATARDLDAARAQGRCLPELAERLAAHRIELPPLRQRREDIPAIAQYCLRSAAEREFRTVPVLSAHSLNILLTHSWPCNIAELDALMERAAAAGSEAVIADELLHPLAPDQPRGATLRRAARQASLDAQRQVILEALHASHWNRRRAARALNISYRALLYKLHDTGIPGKRALARLLAPAAGGNS